MNKSWHPYSQKDYEDHKAFKQKFHNILTADVVDPKDNIAYDSNQGLVEVQTEIVVFNQHFYNRIGLWTYFTVQLAKFMEEMQQRQNNLACKIRKAASDNAKIHRLLQEFPSDWQLMIQDPWLQVQIDTKMWVKYTCIPEWSNSETAKNWVGLW